VFIVCNYYKDVTLSTVSVNTLRQSDSVPDATQKRRHVDTPIIVAGAQRVQPLLQLYHSDDLDRWVGMSQSQDIHVAAGSLLLKPVSAVGGG